MDTNLIIRAVMLIAVLILVMRGRRINYPQLFVALGIISVVALVIYYWDLAG